MHGRRFCAATSWARRCFFTVTGKYVPPLTVASLATTTTSRPATRPMPVMIPAAGASPPYMPCAASGESSRNGLPGSSRAATRSRGSSLPLAECRSRAVGVDDVGAAVGVTGPAIYRHFASKYAMLAEMLLRISERLLEGGLERIASAGEDPAGQLRAL